MNRNNSDMHEHFTAKYGLFLQNFFQNSFLVYHGDKILYGIFSPICFCIPELWTQCFQNFYQEIFLVRFSPWFLNPESECLSLTKERFLLELVLHHRQWRASHGPTCLLEELQTDNGCRKWNSYYSEAYLLVHWPSSSK